MKPHCEKFLLDKLTINPAKCEAVCFGRGRLKKTIIGAAEMDHKTSCKFLGAHLDKKVNLFEHIDCVVKKVNKF